MSNFKIILLLIMLSVSCVLYAQKPERGHRIEAAKIGFLTNRLNLTPDEAKGFWPIYDEFEGQRKTIRKSLKTIWSETSSETVTEKDLKENMKQFFALRQKEIDLEKQYFEKFQQVITIRQVAELYRSEKLFAEELLKRLEQRKKNKQ